MIWGEITRLIGLPTESTRRRYWRTKLATWLRCTTYQSLCFSTSLIWPFTLQILIRRCKRPKKPLKCSLTSRIFKDGGMQVSDFPIAAVFLFHTSYLFDSYGTWAWPFGWQDSEVSRRKKDAGEYDNCLQLGQWRSRSWVQSKRCFELAFKRGNIVHAQSKFTRLTSKKKTLGEKYSMGGRSPGCWPIMVSFDSGNSSRPNSV